MKIEVRMNNELSWVYSAYEYLEEKSTQKKT